MQFDREGEQEPEAGGSERVADGDGAAVDVDPRDFGPFFGFVRGCPAAATLIVAGIRDFRG